MPAFGDGEKLLVTGSTHNELGIRKTDDPEAHAKLVSRINKKILNHRDKITQTESRYLDDSDIAVVCYGFTARSSLYAVEELRKEGRKLGFLRLKTIWPFPDDAIHRVGNAVKKVFAPEMNSGQVAGEIRKYVNCEVVTYNQTNGEIIHPHRIIESLRRL
jgi:2-oxoglutarate ferredoxin oxidoreductase subunit alpha